MLNYLGIALKTFSLLSQVLSDRFLWYKQDFKYHLHLCGLIVWNLVTGMIRFYHAHFHHLVFIHKHKLEKFSDLMDVEGSYVTSQFAEPELNVVHSQPAARMMGFLNNSTKNPSHFPISSLALALMWKRLDALPSFRYEEAIYIDFGCGCGMSLLNALIHGKPFQALFGVELDEKTADFARENIEKFQKQHSSNRNAANQPEIVVENEDMVNFQVPEYYQDNSIVLFLYEPLWTISKADADKIYHKVFRNLKKSAKKEIIVVYFAANKFTGDALPALSSLGFETISSERYPSLFFGASDEMTLFKWTAKKDE
jgi:hypothetical protein